MLDVIGVFVNKRGGFLRWGDEVGVVGKVGVRGEGEEEEEEEEEQNL